MTTTLETPCSIQRSHHPTSYANLTEAALPAHGGNAVWETADLARVAVGGVEPAFNTRPVDERHRTTALARRQQLLDGG